MKPKTKDFSFKDKSRSHAFNKSLKSRYFRNSPGVKFNYVDEDSEVLPNHKFKLRIGKTMGQQWNPKLWSIIEGLKNKGFSSDEILSKIKTLVSKEKSLARKTLIEYTKVALKD